MIPCVEDGPTGDLGDAGMLFARQAWPKELALRALRHGRRTGRHLVDELPGSVDPFTAASGLSTPVWISLNAGSLIFQSPATARCRRFHSSVD
jgi:hypothetical protein